MDYVMNHVNTLVDSAKAEYGVRQGHLLVAKDIITKAVDAKKMPDFATIDFQVLVTTFAAILLVNMLLFSLTPGGRKKLSGWVDKVTNLFTMAVAVGLIFVAIAAPFVAIFYGFKILKFVVLYIYAIPAVNSALAPHVNKVVGMVAPHVTPILKKIPFLGA